MRARDATRVVESLDRVPVGSTSSPLEREADVASRRTVAPPVEAVAPAAPPIVAARTTIDGLMGPGRPLPNGVRREFESRFRHDLSTVRIHDDSRADVASTALNALAFTLGEDIGFARGARAGGKELLGHELAHVVQQRAAGTAWVQRRERSDRGEEFWVLFEDEWKRRKDASVYRDALDDAGPARVEQVERLRGRRSGGDEALEAELKNLVRLTAVELMVEHRRAIEARREVTLGGGAGEALAAARAAVDFTRDLKRLERELEGSRSTLDALGVADRRYFFFDEGDFEDWKEELLEAASQHPADDAWYADQQELLALSWSRHEEKLPSEMSKLARRLRDGRERQLLAARAALAAVYELYPFLAKLDAEDVSVSVAHTALRRRIVEAYDDLRRDVDDAIARIGSGDIEALDLPEAVAVARAALPAPLAKRLDRIVKTRETVRTLTGLAAALGLPMLVLVPVIGPGAAAGIGGGFLATDVEALLDRHELTAASTDPSGEMLGVRPLDEVDALLIAVSGLLALVGVKAAWSGRAGAVAGRTSPARPAGPTKTRTSKFGLSKRARPYLLRLKLAVTAPGQAIQAEAPQVAHVAAGVRAPVAGRAAAPRATARSTPARSTSAPERVRAPEPARAREPMRAPETAPTSSRPASSASSSPARSTSALPAARQADLYAAETAAGFTVEQVVGFRRFLGKRFSAREIQVLERLWNDAARPDDAGTLTAANSRYLFDLHRNRFWSRVRANPEARAIFEDAGCRFSGGAPYFMHRGRRIGMTIDHIVERQSAPHLALTASNLRISFRRENTVVLRLLHELDPFQNQTPAWLRSGGPSGGSP